MNVISGMKMAAIVRFYERISVEEGGFIMLVPNEACNNKAGDKSGKNKQKRKKGILKFLISFIK